MKKVSKLAFHEALRGYLFIAPALILLLGLLFLPMVKGFGYSLTDFNILKSWDYNFIGLENFQKILKNRDFPVILKNEVFFALTVTVITVIVSILIALLLNSVKRCKNIVRALVFMPWVLPEVVVGSLWRWLLNGEKGLINSVLVDYWHVLPEHIQFFSSSLSLISVCMVYIWRTYPYVTIMLSAGLQGIDRGLYEAASIDGCGKIKQFCYVTLPGLKYVLSICSLMAMADMPRPDEGTAIDEDKAFYRMISSNQEISVSSISENIDACGEFLQYLIDEDYWHKWVTEVGARTPADKASYEDDALRAETQAVQPDLVKMYDEGTLMTGVKPKPSYGGVTEIQTTMSQYLVDIITGRYDSVEEGLNELNTECQALLDEYSEE